MIARDPKGETTVRVRSWDGAVVAVYPPARRRIPNRRPRLVLRYLAGS